VRKQKRGEKGKERQKQKIINLNDRSENYNFEKWRIKEKRIYRLPKPYIMRGKMDLQRQKSSREKIKNQNL
jgi:hypothetical protein